MSNMKAALIQKDRTSLGNNCFVEIVIWQVSPVPGSAHGYKYRLALVIDDACVLRYDNEAGKGDHKHLGGCEFPYTFTTPEQLVHDFWADAAQLL